MTSLMLLIVEPNFRRSTLGASHAPNQYNLSIPLNPSAQGPDLSFKQSTSVIQHDITVHHEEGFIPSTKQSVKSS